MNRSSLFAACAVLAGLSFARAGELPKTAPGAVGLSAGKLAELTPALQKLVDDGKIAGGVVLYDPVAALEQSPGIWHDSKTIADLTRELGKVALAHQPGERWTYGLSHDVLGRVVEVVAGEGFDRYLQEHILKPLDMVDTFFLVPEGKRDRVATLYLAGPLGKLAPMPANYGSATFFSGGGGFFSTARDYSRFAQMLLQGGTLEGRRFLRPETIDAMTKNQIGESAMSIPGIPAFEGLKYGLGFGLEPAPGSGGAAPVLGRYFWGGVFSTNFWIDPRHDMVALIMTQVLPFNSGGAASVFRGVVDGAIEK